MRLAIVIWILSGIPAIFYLIMAAAMTISGDIQDGPLIALAILFSYLAWGFVLWICASCLIWLLSPKAID